jgi:hypothetical protein
LAGFDRAIEIAALHGNADLRRQKIRGDAGCRCHVAARFSTAVAARFLSGCRRIEIEK